MEENLVEYSLPQLPYTLDALEPYISRSIMELHYTKHHATYVSKLNDATRAYRKMQEQQDLTGMLALHAALRFNGGGHINHTLFWENLAPTDQGGGHVIESALTDAIEKQFGSVQSMISIFNTQAAAIQGSGWCWLAANKEKKLSFESCANQDPLVTHTPIIGIDVWEHAYYLQYKNARPEYLNAIWNVLNWKVAAQRFDAIA